MYDDVMHVAVALPAHPDGLRHLPYNNKLKYEPGFQQLVPCSSVG